MKKFLIFLFAIALIMAATPCQAANWVMTYDNGDYKVGFNSDTIKHYTAKVGPITEGSYSYLTASTQAETVSIIKIQDVNLVYIVTYYCNYTNGVKTNCYTPVYEEKWPKPGSVMEYVLQQMVNYGRN